MRLTDLKSLSRTQRVWRLWASKMGSPSTNERSAKRRRRNTLSARSVMHPTASGESVRRVVGSISIQIWVALCGLVLLVLPLTSAAQVGPDTRPAKDHEATGQLTVQVQHIAGTAFFEGATVALFTRHMEDKVLAKLDQSGHAHFTALRIGKCIIKITAPGYRAIQEAVMISGTREDQSIVVWMVPTSFDAKANGSAVSVSPKAVKETEKALHALQLNKLDDAEQHLERALAIDPNFADGNYLMGVLLLRQKESGKASGYLQKSVDLSPNHAPALLALGEAEYLQQDFSRAIESLERFLREQPHSPQAPTAQKYVDAMRRYQRPKVDAETGAGSLGPSALGVEGSKTTDSRAETANLELPPLPVITPTTETNWAPPDVDDEKIDFDSTAPCRLDEVIRSASNRVQELVQNVDRFTATEEIDHFNLSPMGLQTSHETRKFEYLVEIRQLGARGLDVEEYRNSSLSREGFPGNIATIGLPSLALVFHPYFQAKYEFHCEGHGSWQGNPAWLIHFQLRTDHASAMLVYNVGGHSHAVGQKGRAWIDAETFQILAMESDIMHPLPEIRLLRDHQLIEYGPVSFRNNSMQLWLPKSADWYASLSGRRYHRRHTFSHFLLFSVDDKQEISKPNEPVKSSEPE
jgi:tetratricopeptide (TPR) repeat protein